jgi:YegS/Rv2252/BmrU family lipid kinase
MKCKTVALIINPAAGKNLRKLTDILAVLSAAGWKTDTSVKEFGGQSRELAKDAAKAGHDLVIAYGGDGTLNQVVNGVMAAGHRETIVGVLPGGTANVWAHEIGLPEDPLKAALFLVNSDSRWVDLGHVQAVATDATDRREHAPLASGGRDYFLLMAGLGLDAAVMRYVSTPLKKRFGKAAVLLSAVKELLFRTHTAFSVEIRSSGDGKASGVLWSGQAIQVVVGNTRQYGGNIAEVTPDAYIDDGLLDVCVITAGNPLTTFHQVLSTLTSRTGASGGSEHFQGAHLWIMVPASVNLQLDGSLVKRLHPKGATATYRFDAMPRALRMAIPCTYDDRLFEDGAGRRKATAHTSARERALHDAVRVASAEPQGARAQSAAQRDALLEHGRKITVIAVAPDPQGHGASIVAGGTCDKDSGESKPVAVRTDRHTTFVSSTGEPLSAGYAAELRDGGVIVVEGKQSKRGVIRAKRVVVVS